MGKGGSPRRSWELAVSTTLRTLRLDSIRNKIFAFTLLATLIPSLDHLALVLAKQALAPGKDLG